MLNNAVTALSTITHHGLKHACHTGKNARRHLVTTKACQSPVASTTGHSPSRDSRPLLTHLFERHPKPINVTTLTPTKVHAEDVYHPFHIKVKRRLKAFDPNKFCWRVHVPMDVSKKAAVRRWAAKRVREAFRQELKARGFTWDGARVDGRGERLRGALLIVLPKDGQRTLGASYEQVVHSVGNLAGKVVEAQTDPRYSFRRY